MTAHPPAFSLDRRITVLVLFLTTLVVGAAAALRIPVELFPAGYDHPFLVVRVPWEDAPSREVLDKVTLPLEEELSTVRGIQDLITISRTGMTIALIPFKHGTDMDVAYREVRDRVERAKARFPSDVERVYVQKDDPSGIPVHVLGIAVDPEISDAYNLIQNEIVLPLERVDGVASIEVEGLIEKEILIELDREKTTAAGLNIWELAQQLDGDNFTMASGTVREGPRKLLLRSIARYDDLQALERRLVGPAVRLRDIARVGYEQPDVDFRVRAMSRPAVAAVVFKEGEANVREVSDRVAAVVAEFETNPRLGSTETVTLFSQGEVIDEALSTLLNSGLIGGVIAAVVLLFFLRRFRLTVILALAIPLSMLIGLTAMYFAGESLNLLTLLGLMICVGLLVDNSVVVAENIHRLRRDGLDRRSACVRGAGEVGLAITMSTLTTIVVFLPVALVEGPGQFFLLRLAIPVCVSVAGSLLVALVFVPLCVYLTLPAAEDGGPPSRRSRWQIRVRNWLRWGYEATFERLNRAYGVMLSLFLRRRLDLVLAVLAVFALTAALPAKQVEFGVEGQEEERAGFGFMIEMPRGTTLDEAEAWFLEAEKVVESKRDELGLEGWFLFHRAHYGELQGWFNQPRTAEASPKEAARIVKEALPPKPGMKLIVMGERESVEDDGQGLFSVELNGEDPEQLEVVSGDLEELFVQVQGVLGLKGSSEPPPNELALVVDRQRTQRLAINPQVVAGVVGMALRGTPLPEFYRDGKEIPVRIRFEESDRESLTELADFMVPTASGEFVSLSAVTDPRFVDPPGTIERRNKRIARSIVLELEEGTEDATRERLGTLIAAIDLPEGITFGSAGALATGMDEDLAGMLFALVLSIVFIYLLMGFLFESFILPLSIIFTIPLSVIGVYWTHWVAGRDIDMLGVVAIVILVGVVVNNGIVLIDYVNRLRQRGGERTEALLAATSRRFRPIMMTAITTIGGLIPLAFAGANSIGLSYTSFSLTLIGGMTTGTLLTLLVVPVLYAMFDDVRELALLRLHAVLRRRAGQRLAASPRSS